MSDTSDFQKPWDFSPSDIQHLIAHERLSQDHNGGLWPGLRWASQAEAKRCLMRLSSRRPEDIWVFSPSLNKPEPNGTYKFTVLKGRTQSSDNPLQVVFDYSALTFKD